MLKPHHFRALGAAAIAVLAAHAGAQSPLFSATQRSYGTGLTATSQGYYPQGHVPADLDGDGDLDIVVAQIGNFIAGRFSILVNRGDGSYEAPRFVALTTPTTTETADVVAADFDGDLDIDLAFCAGGFGTSGQTVGVFRNNGDATFAAMQYYACGRGPTGIVAFDADRDGDVDLATANWYWNEADVSVLYNNGAAAFATRVDFPIAGTQPYKIAAGDLNGDQWPDLAVSVATSTTSVALLFNNQSGGFGAPASLAPAVGSTVNSVPGVHVADVDNDADLDVLYAAGAPVGSWGSIGLYRNNGAGSFAALESFAVTIGSAHDFTVADVTQDGWPDILCVGHSNKYGYSLLPSNGQGGFLVEQSFRTGENARSISAGDVDLDGDLDVVVANSGSNTITVHTNESGNFSMPYAVTTAAFCNGIASGDIDLDGDRDVVTTDSRIWNLFNDGTGHLTANLQSANFGTLGYPKLADVNGDGYVDLLVKTNTVLLALNEGAIYPGFFQPLSPLSIGSVNNFDVFDADNDGDMDVIGVTSSGTNRLALIKNDGSGAFGAVSYTSSASVAGGSTITTGDLDNDGDKDVVYGNGNAVAWLNNGTGSFGAPLSTAAAGGFLRIVKGDFNGDGKLDVAGVNYDYNGQGENMVVLLGNGNGTFGAPATYYGMFSLQYGGTTSLATLDADQDGDLDIVCGAYGGDDVVLFVNAGNGTFDAPVGYGISGSTTTIHVADLDNDGLADVLANVGTEPPIGGVLQVLFGKRDARFPFGYCSAGTSSRGCVPVIGASGWASASAASPLTITVGGLDGQQTGLIYYGLSGRVAVAWGASTSFLCVKTPFQRCGAQPTGGTPLGCDGSLALDWNAFHAANPNALGAPFQAGTVVDVQGWWRDPPSAKATALSSALEFTVQP